MSVIQSKSHTWLTLITCEDFDAGIGLYQSRRAVQAVLIRVDD
jgi:sortase (surface protein transpeptidase)